MSERACMRACVCVCEWHQIHIISLWGEVKSHGHDGVLEVKNRMLGIVIG